MNGNPANISQTQSKRAVNALGICISRRRASTCGLLCLVAFHIQRGRFLLVLVCRVLQEPPFREQARIRFHAFFVVYMQVRSQPQKRWHAIQLIWVRNLPPNSLSPLLVCLWLCPQQVQTPTFAAKPFYRCRQLYLLRLVGLAIPDTYRYHNYPLFSERYQYRTRTYAAR